MKVTKSYRTLYGARMAAKGSKGKKLPVNSDGTFWWDVVVEKQTDGSFLTSATKRLRMSPEFWLELRTSAAKISQALAQSSAQLDEHLTPILKRMQETIEKFDVTVLKKYHLRDEEHA